MLLVCSWSNWSIILFCELSPLLIQLFYYLRQCNSVRSFIFNRWYELTLYSWSNLLYGGMIRADPADYIFSRRCESSPYSWSNWSNLLSESINLVRNGSNWSNFLIVSINLVPNWTNWSHFSFQGEELSSNETTGLTVTPSTLTLLRATREWSGVYQCAAYSVEGESISNTVVVNIKCEQTRPYTHSDSMLWRRSWDTLCGIMCKDIICVMIAVLEL